MIRVVEFKTEYRVGKEPRDKVLIAPQGPAFEKTQTWHYVNSLRPPEDIDEGEKQSLKYIDMRAKWEVIGPAYEAWRSGQQLPETGTPLDAWSGVTADQAKFLKRMDIRTVEDVRDMGDAALSQLKFPNARKLPEMAKKWLEGTNAAEKDAEIADLKEKMAAMEEMLEEAAKTKRGPGRPKKTEAA